MTEFDKKVNELTAAVLVEIEKDIQEALVKRIANHPNEIVDFMKTGQKLNSAQNSSLCRALNTVQFQYRDLTEEEQELSKQFLDIEWCATKLSRKHCGKALAKEIMEQCEYIASKRQLNVDEYNVYCLAKQVLGSSELYGQRNLTEEESTIYDDWINSHAKKTGERLF